MDVVMGLGADTQEGEASDACASHAVLQEGRWTVAWSEYLGRVCDLEVERRVCSVSCFSPTLIIKRVETHKHMHKHKQFRIHIPDEYSS